MEKLNEYLKTLLSSCSDELRLEPDRNPYLVSANTTTDLANVPLVGPQISTMVFPLIPPAAKSALPNSNEIEFVLPHNLGNFNFNVQKSPGGFIVTIRPLITDSEGSIPIPQPLPEMTPIAPPIDLHSTFANEQPTVESIPVPQPLEELLSNERPVAAPSYQFESSSLDLEQTMAAPVNNAELADLLFEEREQPAQEYVSSENVPEIAVVDVNDPQFQTVFSDTSTYEPPGRRDDFDLGDLAGLTSEEAANHMIEPPAQANGSASAPTAPPPAYETLSPSPVAQPTPTPAAQASFSPSPSDSAEKAKMDALFHKMAELGASDLHLSVSMPAMIRKDGKMRPLRAEDAPFTPDEMLRLITSIMPPRNQEEFAKRSDTDFAYEIAGLARFRCNIFMDRKGMGAVFRIIPSKMTTASQIGLSEAVLGLCGLSKGLVVITGPTGSGKSTTLCAMVNEINMTREEHIITIEDPIEFVHDNIKCLVNQREVHNHTDTFKDALRAALREDPDIVLVGEMRDLETISIAIETAETGHLVFGTLHTTTAASTVDRIIDQFPADRQQQIRVMLSESLKGVIAQTLLPKKGGGRVAALEVLIVTPAISNLIREGKTFQIPSAMQTGKNHGMVMLNDALFEHVKNGNVEPMDAYIKAVDKSGFEAQLTRGGFKL